MKKSTISTKPKQKIVPVFPKHIRDEILNFTDDKEHKSYLKVIDSNYLYKILMGAKNVSKSFGKMIDTIWKIVNVPGFCSIWARNISKDIDRTLSPNFKKAIDFLAVNYGIDFTDYFDTYKNVVVFTPTGQAIYFCNFELVNSFAGITLPKDSFFFGEVVCDEIQQNPDELGDSKNFSYEKQKKDMDFIIQSTILRTKLPPDIHPCIFFTFNVYDSTHWLCENYVKPIMPFSNANREKILKEKYLFAESEELNCCVMRMSRFYVPKETIADLQMQYYEKLKISDPKLYDITIAGEAYDLDSTRTYCPFKRFIFNDENQVYEHLIFKDDMQNTRFIKNTFQLFVDGFDPGLRDLNGYCRIGLTKEFKIVVIFTKLVDSKQFKQEAKMTATKHILLLAVALNELLDVDQSVLAIDSKEDVIIDSAMKICLEQEMPINVIKAIKNKNPNFRIDFNIANRMNFIKDCFEQQLIQFTPNCVQLLEFLTQITVDENNTRDEKINPGIYDLINAFEYALSIVYNLVIINNPDAFGG